MTVSKRKFKAEVNKILDLMIHSLYSHKEIFLRELISNASDAIDKARYLALTDTAINPEGNDWQVELIPDKEAGTLTVRDNGVGLTRDEATLQLVDRGEMALAERFAQLIGGIALTSGGGRRRAQQQVGDATQGRTHRNDRVFCCPLARQASRRKTCQETAAAKKASGNRRSR